MLLLRDHHFFVRCLSGTPLTARNWAKDLYKIFCFLQHPDAELLGREARVYEQSLQSVWLVQELKRCVWRQTKDMLDKHAHPDVHIPKQKGMQVTLEATTQHKVSGQGCIRLERSTEAPQKRVGAGC